MVRISYAPPAVGAAFIRSMSKTIRHYHYIPNDASLKKYIVNAALNGNISYEMATVFIQHLGLGGK